MTLQNPHRLQSSSVIKTVTPTGEVEYGDELTYTLVISAALGVQVGLYDPLTSTTFTRFVQQPTVGVITHTGGIITGTLTVTPTNQVTVSFVAQVDFPGTPEQTDGITNRACIYPFGGTLANCIWSNEVSNTLIRKVYLPLVLRDYAALQADFTAAPTSGPPPLTVVFTNTSTGNYTNSLWHFGDGVTSTQTSPVYTYTMSGEYTVTLTVSKMSGTQILPGDISTMTRPNYIIVFPEAPSDLQATPISCSQIQLDWQDNSSNETGFTIYDGITTTDVGADTTSHTFEGLAPTSYHCFLVRAFNDHGPSHWSNWACTTTLSGTEEIINGSFEDDTAWEFPATPYPATYTVAITHTGSRAARTGIVDPADNIESWSSVQQTVTVPADVVSATLRFWVYPISGEPPYTPTVAARPPLGIRQDALTQIPEDMQYVIVLNEADDWIRYLLWRRADEQRWILYERDMTVHAGQTIKLRFGSVNDGADGVTAMYIDDVSLEICDSTAHVGLSQRRLEDGVLNNYWNGLNKLSEEE